VKDDRLYLVHISECIERVERYTQGGEEGFFRDEKTQDAVVRNLQVLAESSMRLSAELKESHPEVDWRMIAGFRNVVVHDYLGLNMRTEWAIVTRDLPELKRRITTMLKS
jgi:uncharacterized protein with HEPN domain